MKFWLAFRPRNESSKISFCLKAVRVLVYSGSAHREPVLPLLIAAAECCWAAALQLTQALSHRATPPLFPTLLHFWTTSSEFCVTPLLERCESENLLFQMMTHLYCWRPFFTLTWTNFLAQTTPAGVGACETIPCLCENLWKWICESCSNGFVGTQLLYFLADVELHFRWDVEHDGGGGAEPQPLTGHACHDDAGNKKIL